MVKLSKSNGWIKKKLDKLVIFRDGEKGNWYTEIKAKRIQEDRELENKEKNKNANEN